MSEVENIAQEICKMSRNELINFIGLILMEIKKYQSSISIYEEALKKIIIESGVHEFSPISKIAMVSIAKEALEKGKK